MLKLEKKARYRDIQVTLRHREGTSNRLFWVALGVAFAFHAAGFVLFRIAPFPISERDIIHAPIVFTGKQSDFLVSSDINHNEQPLGWISPPPLSEPTTLSLSPSLDQNSLDAIPFQIHLFAERSRGWIMEPFDPRGRQHQSYSPIQVSLSGPLAQHNLLDDGISSIETKLKGNGIIYRGTFVVQLNQQTGHLFWFEPKEKPQSPDLQLKAETILRAVRFQPQKNGFVVPGEVEIIFRIPEANHV